MEPGIDPTSEPAVPTAPPARPRRIGLSGKLLFLTVLFVMVAEILIYVPSIANFRLVWLNDRLAAAHTAALVLDAAPSGMVPESLAKQILESIGARAVAMKMGSQRRLLAAKEVPSEIEQDIDMRDVRWWHAIVDAFDTMLLSSPTDVLRLVGPAPMAAAMGSSIKNTSLAPADSADSFTAFFSTSVIPLGTPITMRGLASRCPA